MDNDTSSLSNLQRKLDLANDAILRLQQKIIFVQSIADATLLEINLFSVTHARYQTVHNEYETRVRTFESNYWLSVFEISERSHRGFDDPSAIITTEDFIALETDRDHFIQSLSTIPPDLNDYYPPSATSSTSPIDYFNPVPPRP